MSAKGPVDMGEKTNVFHMKPPRYCVATIIIHDWEAELSFIRGNREKNGEPSWGSSDIGATTAPW